MTFGDHVNGHSLVQLLWQVLVFERPTQSGVVAHSSHLSSQESGVGGLEVESQSQIHRQLQASLGYMNESLPQ